MNRKEIISRLLAIVVSEWMAGNGFHPNMASCWSRSAAEANRTPLLESCFPLTILPKTEPNCLFFAAFIEIESIHVQKIEKVLPAVSVLKISLETFYVGDLSNMSRKSRSDAVFV